MARDAELAWERAEEQSSHEFGLRSNPYHALATNDPIWQRWTAASKRQFLAAWEHVRRIDAEDIRKDYASFLTSPKRSTVRQAVEALSVDVGCMLTLMRSDEGARTFRNAISSIEGVLVACLGHYSPRPRSLSVRLLNALYDGIDWQLAAAHPVTMAHVGDDFTVNVLVAPLEEHMGSVNTENNKTSDSSISNFSGLNAVRVLVCAPTYDRSAAGGLGAGHCVTMHAPRIEAEDVWLPSSVAAPSSAENNEEAEDSAIVSVEDASPAFVRVTVLRVRLQLAPFNRCGFFDWRVVVVGADGVARPLPAITPLTPTELSAAIAAGLIPASDTTPQATGGMTPMATSASVYAQSSLANALRLTSDDANAPGGGSTGNHGFYALAQGRYVVQKAGLREECMHEVIVDLEGMKFSDGGEIVRHGTFADVTERLRGLRTEVGVTSLFVRGAIERDNGWGETEADLKDQAVAAAIDQGLRSPTQRNPAITDGSPAVVGGTTANGTAPGQNAFLASLRPVTLPLGGTSTGGTGIVSAGGVNIRLGNGVVGGLSAAVAGAAATMGVSAFSSRAGSVTSDTAGDGSDFGYFSVLDEPGNGGGRSGASVTSPQPQLSQPLQQQQQAQPTQQPSGSLVPPGGVSSAGEGRGDGSVLPAGARAFCARPDANPHAVVDRHTPNRMLGGHLGFSRLCSEARALGMSLIVQLDPSVSASRPHRKYRSLYARTLDTKGQAVVHHGSDALENQWEDQHLLNYRKVEAWDLLVSEAKTLVQNFGVGGLYLVEAQSYPFIMALDAGELFRRDVDGEGHYTAREILEGDVVVANTETGYWTTRAAREYPNPLLVKLTRALWAISPDFVVIGESHWGRAGALMRSGVLPHSVDVVSAMATTLGRFVDKNGTVTSISLAPSVLPVQFLRALVAGEHPGVVPAAAAPQFVSNYLHSGSGFPNPMASLLAATGGAMPAGGAPLLLRGIATARLPYPALLLGRSAWTAVDLLYTLPGVPLTFAEERVGRAYRVDVTGTYSYNPAYVEDERKKREKRLLAEKTAARYRHAAAASGGAAGAALLASANRGNATSANGVGASAQGPVPFDADGSRSSSGGLMGGGGAGGSSVSGGSQIDLGRLSISAPHGSTASLSNAAAAASASAYEHFLEGDVGVGGVVPATPIRGAPSFKIARTGFSHLHLPALLETEQGGAEWDEKSARSGGDGRLSVNTRFTQHPPAPLSSTAGGGLHHGHQSAPSWASTLPPRPPMQQSAMTTNTHGIPQAQYGSASSTISSGARLPNVWSSPALQTLLLSALAEQEGTPRERELPNSSPGGSSSPEQSNKDAASTVAAVAMGGTTLNGADTDEEEDESDEEGAGESGPAGAEGEGTASRSQRRRGASGGGPHAGSGGASGGGFGFHLLSATSAAGDGVTMASPGRGKPVGQGKPSKLRSSWAPEDGTAGPASTLQTSPPTALLVASETTALGSGRKRSTAGGHSRGEGGGGSSTSSEITRVTSWAAMDTMTFKGADVSALLAGTSTAAASASLRDNVRGAAAMEARLRAEVGPQYGFDLAQISGHYAHRRALRARYGVLRNGNLTVLAARHRFGEHGHVFAFGRAIPGCVAVVAANFNGHPSTFAVDCSPLVTAFGASTTSDASASVAQLMTSGVAAGEDAVRFLKGETSLSSQASLNLRGGVWEVRDIFASDANWTGRAGAAVPVPQFDGVRFSEVDGPLIGIMSSEEAAYAPMLRTLSPHRSYCWLYVAASASASSSSSSLTALPSSGNSSALRIIASPNTSFSSSSSAAAAETDPAAMQWLFASSLLRLQSVLRLKECGLATAVITRMEVDAAGGIAQLRKIRHPGSNEPWISPGEALKDGEIQSAARHNLVYSLLRHVVKRAHRTMTAAAAARTGEGRSEATPAASARNVTAAVAANMEAALRVLVTHWQLVQAPDSSAGVTFSATSYTGGEPGHLIGAQLPSLHASMNRSGNEQFTHGGDPAWYCIDGDVAVSVARTALFLAVKDVTQQQHAMAGAAAAAAAVAGGETSVATTSSGAARSTDADVHDDDAALSAVLLRALVHIAQGRTPVGAALAAASNANGNGVPAVANREATVITFARRLLWTNRCSTKDSPIVFVTPELGKWSTVGGLGVMVDELSVGLAELGASVVCISPYYHLNRKGVSDYLAADGIQYAGYNVGVWVGSERVEMGVHVGTVKGVRLFFLHNAEVFPRPYPPHDAFYQTRVLTAFGKGCLELLCQRRIIPSVIITNDWFTGLVPAYARHGHFGDAFNRTDFMHIAHNLDPDYEGRLWPGAGAGSLQHVHGLPSHLLVDPHWHDIVINPTRAALLCSDTWATVSRSYRQDLLESSPLRGLLRLAPHPFAHPNGIPVRARAARLARLPTPTHEEAKVALQRKYFGFENGDPSLPLFAFVGRITLQKGVHLILQSVDELLRYFHGGIMFLVGGMASQSDSYGLHCSHVMRDLAARHRGRFWANPDLFFSDGDLVNLGADVCMMPSMFEPGGIVQHEFLVAGTPVLAFRTGGLKDTVREFDPSAPQRGGNGFLFEAHAAHDFIEACKRAVSVYREAPLYAQLRANARASVMDLDVVSLAWYREFHRLRRSLPPPPRIAPKEQNVTFSLAVGDVPGLTASSSVAVTGSFANWSRKLPLQLQPDGHIFSTTVPLLPGDYQFKFIVDGVWVTASTQPTEDNGSGMINNVLVVHDAIVDDEASP